MLEHAGDAEQTVRGFASNLAALAGQLYDRLPCKQPVLSMLEPLGLPHSVYRHLHFIGELEVATPRESFRMFHRGDEIENGRACREDARESRWSSG